MLARLDPFRRSFATRILAVAALSLFGFAAVVLLVVRNQMHTVVTDQTRERVDGSSRLLRRLVDERGAARIEGDKLLLGEQPANGDTGIVDAIQGTTGATATIFQLRESKLVRVTTNVKKADGSRAVGTELQGPAAASFAAGRDFSGVVPILGKPYVTRYEILRDGTGTPVGMIYTGIPLTAINAATRDAFTAIAVAAAVAGVIGLGMLGLLVRGIRRDVRRVSAAARSLAREDLPVLLHATRALADGDLTYDVHIAARPSSLHRTDEIGAVAADVNELAAGFQEADAAFDAMRAGLRTVIREVQANAEELNQASGRLSGAAQESSNAVAEVATAVTEVAEGTTRQAGALDGAVMAVSRMDEQARTVGRMVELIHDIAERTNLLALNAAIEAARAGEQGRGFAVVADEVRKLATRSTDAVREIGGSVEEIGTAAREASKATGAVAHISEQTAAAAEEISATTEEMNAQVEELSVQATRLAETAVRLHASIAHFNAGNGEELETTVQLQRVA